MNQIEKAITDFKFHCQYEKNLSQNTLKCYWIDLSQFQEIVKEKGFNKLAQLDKFYIKEYLKILTLKYKPKSVKRKIACIKAMFIFWEFEDIIVVNPFRKIRIKIKEPKQLPTVLTKKEIFKLFRHMYSLKDRTSNISGHKHSKIIKDIAILELLFSTGIRVSELCNLNIENINLKEGVIKVIGKGSKERVIQICNKETLTSLKEYKNTHVKEINTSGAFFVNRLSNRIAPQSVRILITGYISKCNFSKHVTPHTFRHSFATLLLEKEVDIYYIQKLLGHSSITTTQIYTQISQKKLRQVLMKKHPREDLILIE